MRAIVVLYIAAWLTGIAAGLYERWPVVFLAAAVAMLLARQLGQSLPHVLTAGILVLLGGVYAGTALAAPPVCEPQPPATILITGEPQVGAGSVQYEGVADGCPVLVFASRFPVYGRGAQLAAEGGSVQTLADITADNPGYAAYLSRRGISVTWRYPELRAQTAVPDASYRTMLRQRLEQLLPEPAAGIASAMLLGERRAVSVTVTEQFRASGVSHVLAISGLHITLLMGGLLLLIRLLPLSWPIRDGVLLGLLWAYLTFIGLPLSAVRAGLFWTLALLAFRLRLLVSLPTVLLLALLILVSVSPAVVAEVSLQLSAIAVAGIFLALFLLRPLHDRLPVYGRGLAGSIAVSVGATLATAPLAAMHFGTIAPGALLANLGVVPVIPALMVTSAVVLLVSFIATPIALLLAVLVRLLVAWIMFVTSIVSVIPGAFVADVTVQPWHVGLWYGALGLFVAVTLRWQGRSWREVWV